MEKGCVLRKGAGISGFEFSVLVASKLIKIHVNTCIVICDVYDNVDHTVSSLFFPFHFSGTRNAAFRLVVSCRRYVRTEI